MPKKDTKTSGGASGEDMDDISQMPAFSPEDESQETISDDSVPLSEDLSSVLEDDDDAPGSAVDEASILRRAASRAMGKKDSVIVGRQPSSLENTPEQAVSPSAVAGDSTVADTAPESGVEAYTAEDVVETFDESPSQAVMVVPESGGVVAQGSALETGAEMQGKPPVNVDVVEPSQAGNEENNDMAKAKKSARSAAPKASDKPVRKKVAVSSVVPPMITRGRGRPRKSESVDVAPSPEAAMPKRRGRPKSSEIKAVAAKRGRPAKAAVVTTGKRGRPPKAVAATVTTGKRGRPRKVESAPSGKIAAQGVGRKEISALYEKNIKLEMRLSEVLAEITALRQDIRDKDALLRSVEKREADIEKVMSRWSTEAQRLLSSKAAMGAVSTRRRGRPAKSKAAAGSTATRGRGRPPKAAAAPTTTRGRGRPPKAASAPTTTRGRGRPRKAVA